MFLKLAIKQTYDVPYGTMIKLLIPPEDLISHKTNSSEPNPSFSRACSMREWTDELIGRRSVLYV